MRYEIITKQPNRLDLPSKFVDIIIGDPTTHRSRASLLLLNEYYLMQEMEVISKKLNINLDDYSDCTALTLMGILRSKFNRQFIGKSKKVCEYCNRPVYNHVNRTRTDSITVDHKQPLVDGCDWFDEGNLAISCYKCNNEKMDTSYDVWLNIIQARNKKELFLLSRMEKVHYFIEKNASEISDMISNQTSVKKFMQIARIAKIIFEDLQIVLLKEGIIQINDESVVERVNSCKKDTLFLMKIYVDAHSKIYPSDKDIKDLFNNFLMRNSKWQKILQIYNKKKLTKN